MSDEDKIINLLKAHQKAIKDLQKAVGGLIQDIKKLKVEDKDLLSESEKSYLTQRKNNI